jgi:alcohol dehydrogenase (cytochrome c)
VPGLLVDPRRLMVASLLALLALGAFLMFRRSTATKSPPIRPVTDARLIAPDSSADEWLSYGRDYANQRFSPLDQINRGNVAGLTRVWYYNRHRLSRAPDRSESTPIALDGMLIYSDYRNIVLALDARTGRRIWRYDHENGPTALCCGLVNRGLAAYGDKIYMATLDARLVALDRRTGEKRWDRAIADPSEGYSFSMAPVAAAGRIVVGASGGDFGARGFLDAYDPTTGERLWRFWTIPSPDEGGWWGRWTATTPHGESLHRDIAKERRDSARYSDAWKHGGAAVWTTPAYDPDLGLLIFTTGNPAPVDGVTPPGDNLYSTSLVAVDVTTGRLRWYYQMVPHNIWDYDAANPTVLLDVTRHGKTVPLAAHAGKTGWVYLVDRRTGAPFLRSEPFIPLENIFPPATLTGVRSSPGDRGGSNWPPSAFSPRTGLLYIQASYAPMVFVIDPAQAARRERGELPAFADFRPAEPGSESGTFTALDPATGQIRWQRKTRGHLAYGGVLVTAGQLVFFSEGDGNLNALDAETGATLWRYRVGGKRALGSPIAFAVDGEQRIAVSSLEGLTVFGLRDK